MTETFLKDLADALREQGIDAHVGPQKKLWRVVVTICFPADEETNIGDVMTCYMTVETVTADEALDRALNKVYEMHENAAPLYVTVSRVIDNEDDPADGWAIVPQAMVWERADNASPTVPKLICPDCGDTGAPDCPKRNILIHCEAKENSA